MSLKSFMALSIVFRTTAQQTDFNPFLAGRLEREYYTLGVEDRLRIHSLINRRDHFDNPTEKMANLPLEKRWELLHMFHELVLLKDRDTLVRQINAGTAPPMNAYMAATLKGRIPVFIALDLGAMLKHKLHM